MTQCPTVFSDLESDLMKKEEVSNVTVSPDQSLLLCCRFKNKDQVYPVWEKGSEILNARALACSSKNEKEVQ